MQVGDDNRIDAAAHHIPHMRAFNFSAGTHATRAKDAAVVIHGETLVRGIDWQFGITVWQPDVSQSLLLPKRLQFAVAVGYAHAANVIALGKQHFEYGAAM